MADKPISLQKLVNADKDADTLEQVTSADKYSTIVSRLGRQYPSLAKALQTIIDAGGFKPYSTEADLKASVPVIVPSAAYAFDTKKVWLWNGSAWLDEGTSALDQAKNYANQQIAQTNFDVSNKLKINLDFHKDDGFLDNFLILDKNLNIVFSPELNNKQLRQKAMFKYDFYTYTDLKKEIIFLTKDNFMISDSSKQQEIEKILSGRDFFTNISLASILFISNDGYILSSSGSDVKIAKNETTAKELYLDKNYVRSLRDLPAFYYKDNLYFANSIQLHAAYDELLNLHPNHVSMKILGKDAWDNEIREYTISPPKIANWGIPSIEQKVPKILMVAGVHGAEGTGIIGNYSFIYNLLNNWKKFEYYDLFRMNYQFVVIPVACPSGFNANPRTRGNANHVDLNRNFDADWSLDGSSDPTNEFYYGPSVASELETQILQTWSNTHKDAICAIDHHHGAEAYYFWYGSESEKGRKICFEVLAKTSSYLQKHMLDSESTQVIDNLGRVGINGAGTWMRYIQNLGTLGILTESRFPQASTVIGVDWLKTRKLSERSLIEICNIIHENKQQIQL